MRKMVRPIIISRYLGMSSLFRTLYGDRSLPWRIRPVWIYRPLRNFICGIMISLSAFGWKYLSTCRRRRIIVFWELRTVLINKRCICWYGTGNRIWDSLTTIWLVTRRSSRANGTMSYGGIIKGMGSRLYSWMENWTRSLLIVRLIWVVIAYMSVSWISASSRISWVCWIIFVFGLVCWAIRRYWDWATSY